MLTTLRRELGALAWILRTLTMVAVVAAVYRELQRPPEERTWHGRLMGKVPYDFRIPTPRRLADAWWNPGSDKVITDQPFGVGWSLNLPALLQRITSLGKQSSPGKRSRAAG
ncbi:MAG TPA: hypothetical protein VHK28_02175 [Candidatus Limnocylindria bacterium]|nr:hypothetical protein [Candidatus Limnocylindria bacterium]